MDTIALADLRVFAHVAQTLNLTASARALGLPKSSVSKAISRLERQLSVRILERTTRRVALSSAGRLLELRARSLLSDADALRESLRDERMLPRGIVRVTAPPELGALFAETVLPRVLHAHPGLRATLATGYAFDDLFDPAVDLALRAGDVHDDRLVAHAIGAFRRIAVASASYLARRPVQRIEDLSERECLVFSASDLAADWTFVRGAEVKEVRVDAVCGIRSFDGLLHAARAGLGIARVPAFIAAPWLERGELAAVLPSWSSVPTEVFVVHRFGHERIARVSAMIDAIRTERWLAEPPPRPVEGRLAVAGATASKQTPDGRRRRARAAL